MTDRVTASTPPRALVVYYTFSRQTERVAEEMCATLRERGVDVTSARIEFIDARWSKRFATVPMRFPMLKIVGMLPAQIRRATGEIRIPPGAEAGAYDLVLIGSPTWWFRPSIPVRTWLMSSAGKGVLDGKPFAVFTTSRRYWQRNVREMKAMGEAAGGRYVGQTHFVSAGNQVASMLAWLSFMSGITVFNAALHLPETNLQVGFEEQARRFVGDVAGGILGTPDRG